jgi:DNA-binding CsgD family transcriptional regulator
VLVGRARECRQIETLLSDVAASATRCLVFEGDPGIGKTTLLEHAAATASGFRLLRATGIESEVGLGFAGLLEVTRSITDLLTVIPEPQADALRGALGLAAPVAASRFLVAAGLLSLLAAAAEQSPVLILVDDLQWVDQPSAQVLLFAVRRLRADSVGVIMTTRRGEPVPVRIDGLPLVTLAPLGQEAARALLATCARDVTEQVADRLHAATGGNPLALVEMARSLTPSQRAGHDVLPEPLPSVAALETAYVGRVTALGASTQRALLLFAASGDAAVGSLGPALALQHCTITDLASAADAGLITIDRGRARWQHPLVRSVVYYSATAADRAAAHHAVADGLPEDEPGWAWHRAAAADGPDELVATALDRVAADASRRAGFATAARAAEQAATLSAYRQDAARRLLAAADAAWLAGDAGRAERLLDEALGGTSHDELRGRVLYLRGHTEYAVGRAERAAELFSAAATLLEPHDPGAAADALAQATIACWWHADPEGMTAAAGRLRALAAVHDQLASHADFYAGLAAMFTGQASEGAALIERALAAEQVRRAGASQDPRSVQRLAGLGWLARGGEGHDLGVQRMRALRAQGALGMMPRLLRMTASQDLDDDRWPEAVAEANEALELCEELGQPAHRPEVFGILATVAACRGDATACRRHADAALAAAEQHGQRWARLIALRARGLLALGEGDLATAVSLFEEVTAVQLARGLRGPTVISLPDLVEALARIGRRDDAASRALEFERRVTGVADPRVPPLVARCRALVADGPDADAAYREALSHHRGDPDAFVVARTHLLHGEWLRRHGNRRSARAELDMALKTFERYGATPWAERTRGELRASGAVLRSRPQPGVQLTEAELRVALLAADGLTDREICGQLYLSQKTVEFHLGRIYRKLGVRGRTELARRLPAVGNANSPLPGHRDQELLRTDPGGGVGQRRGCGGRPDGGAAGGGARPPGAGAGDRGAAEPVRIGWCGLPGVPACSGQ